MQIQNHASCFVLVIHYCEFDVIAGPYRWTTMVSSRSQRTPPCGMRAGALTSHPNLPPTPRQRRTLQQTDTLYAPTLIHLPELRLRFFTIWGNQLSFKYLLNIIKALHLQKAMLLISQNKKKEILESLLSSY